MGILDSMSNELIIGFVAAFIGFLLREMYSWKHNELKKAIEAVESLTHTIIKLEAKLEFLLEKTDEIPELKKDLNELGAKVRVMQTKARNFTANKD